MLRVKAVKPKEGWESYLPPQIPETDVQLVFFTPFL